MLKENMKEKVVAIIVARMDSSRLPGKALEDIEGKPMIARIVERVGRASSVDQIMIATTTLPSDDALQDFADKEGLACFRGSENDVLSRVLEAAKASQGDIILDLMGDNPLIHPDMVDEIVSFYRANSYDFVSNVTVEFPHAPKSMPKFPVGLRVQAMSVTCLENCDRLAQSPEHREHVTKFIFDNPKNFAVGYYPAEGKWAKLHRPELTFAVNFRENLEMIRKIYQIAGKEKNDLSMDGIIEIYDKNPELSQLMGNGFS